MTVEAPSNSAFAMWPAHEDAHSSKVEAASRHWSPDTASTHSCAGAVIGSPEFWMPPSAMTGIPARFATRATWNTAVACPRPTAHTCSNIAGMLGEGHAQQLRDIRPVLHVLPLDHSMRAHNARTLGMEHTDTSLRRTLPPPASCRCCLSPCRRAGHPRPHRTAALPAAPSQHSRR